MAGISIRWPGTDLDPKDVCEYGHQLAPGSDSITLRTYDESGRVLTEETKLLRHHLVDNGAFVTPFTPTPDA